MAGRAQQRRISRVLAQARRISAVGFLNAFASRHPWARRAFAILTRPLRHGNRMILRGSARGLQINLHGSRPAYLVGLAENDVLEFLLSVARPGGVFYDVGANVGFISLAIARAVGPEGCVYAFEPAPQTAEAARYNARLNDFEHIDVVQAAVSDKETTLAFATLGESHQQAHVVEQLADEAIVVAAVTIDGFIRGGARPPDLVKIDIEGHEDAALQGMIDTLRDIRPVVLCEIHQTLHADEHVVERILRECGYTCRWLEPGMSREAVWWVPHVIGEPR